MTHRKRLFTPAGLYAIVFLVGAALMIVEMVAGRLLARHLGNSLYTWTAVIGVILGGMTLGYYLGGRIADRHSAERSLTHILVLASLSCLLSMVAFHVMDRFMLLRSLTWTVRVFLHVAVVFFVPGLLLGMVPPVVARTAIHQAPERGGAILGAIYAWNAAGSIVGTCLSGFLLIGALGSMLTLWLVAAMLAVLAVRVAAEKTMPLGVSGIVLLAAVAAFAPWSWARYVGNTLLLRQPRAPELVYEDESAYNYITVEQSSEDPAIRSFYQDKLLHSSVNMNDITAVQYGYTALYATVVHQFAAQHDPCAFLFIGGGGYVMPRYVEHYWPEACVDVVEIDPAVTSAAREAFGLSSSAIRTHHMDARNYIDDRLDSQRRSGPELRYDIVFEDAFNDYNIPFQLVTYEFHEKLKAIMSERALYVVNLIDVYDSGRFLGAYLNTLEKSFAHIAVLAEPDFSAVKRTTFVIVASQSPLPLPERVHSRVPEQGGLVWRFKDEDLCELANRSESFVLTDDFAPVEQLLAPIVAEYSGRGSQRAVEKAIAMVRQAEQLACQGRIEPLLGQLKRLIFTARHESSLVLSHLGGELVARGRYQAADRFYERAVALLDQYQPEDNRTVLYYEWAMVLEQLGRPDQKAAALEGTVASAEVFLERYPDHAGSLALLSHASYLRGDYSRAAMAAAELLAIEPQRQRVLFLLIDAVDKAAPSPELQQCLRETIRHLRDSGHGDLAERLSHSVAPDPNSL